MKIAISGKSGCGNTSVSRLAAEKLGYTMINYTFRTMAEEAGMPFKDFCALAEKDDSLDMRLDQTQVALASSGNCVLGSRLAIWMLEDADFKVYLYADPEVRAARISRRELRPMQEVLAETIARDNRDSARYRRIYSIDTEAYQFADLVLDTNDLNQFEAADIIVEQAREILKTIQ